MAIAGVTVTGASATDMPGTEAGPVCSVPGASTLDSVPAVNAVVADAPASPAMAAGAVLLPVTDTFLRWYSLLGTQPADAAEAHAAQEEALGFFWSLRQAAGLLEIGLMPALPTQAPGLFRGTRWEVPETGPWPGNASQATNIMKTTKEHADGSSAAADGAAIVPDAQ